MAVKIRLTRLGNKKRAFYRIVATNSGTRRDGKPLEMLGYYNPMTNPIEVKVDTDKLKKWMEIGAQPSETVKSLLKDYLK
ncbi:30S ribosomal protein S16 [Desulfovibrio litoralis]|uniref:Small ribosomal subunit protein bS16 n=1 Tax=Desulfovibrio litoralis DSM 11393 TaxID=1121455 RepID=A0A1M7SYS1_9BACT|nr:30S ribosomal protein S16 [Desulfovibrio litoralis]SHN63551.1 small subunit ribosomal protein S16 [Desulfovibrio litoralis DSM 11393]